MNLIAIEASTETLSLAVCQRGQLCELEMAGGPHASASLLPSLQKLMAEMQLSWAQLDAVVWGRGPGSFTGLRTACAVAQGIGFAHDLPLLGIDSLAACAQQASTMVNHPGPWVVALDARMGEVYVGKYAHGQWRSKSMGQYELQKPEDVAVGAEEWLCGNGHVSYSDLRCSEVQTVHALPTGKAMIQLAPALLELGEGTSADMALPLYIRDKVALTTQERALKKQLC